MILDSNLMFDPAGTAITAGGASTNIIDLKNARDIGVGEDPEMKLLILSDGTFAAAGGATLNIQFQGAPDNGSGAPGTWTTYAESGALTIAELNAAGNGTKLFQIDVPRVLVGASLPRFLQLEYVVSTGPFTAGHLQSYMVLGTDNVIGYPSGFTANN